MIRKYAEIFCWKNVSSFCSAKATHIFSAKNIRISAKTVNKMTLNELVKLTTLWTTGPWCAIQQKTQNTKIQEIMMCNTRKGPFYSSLGKYTRQQTDFPENRLWPSMQIVSKKLICIETICTKGQSLFSGKDEKNSSKCHLLEFFPQHAKLYGDRICLVDLLPIYTRVTTFVTSCLLYCTSNPSENRSTQKGKNLIPREANSFL